MRDDLLEIYKITAVKPTAPMQILAGEEPFATLRSFLPWPDPRLLLPTSLPLREGNMICTTNSRYLRAPPATPKTSRNSRVWCRDGGFGSTGIEALVGIIREGSGPRLLGAYRGIRHPC